MKLLVEVFLSLALLESFHCATSSSSNEGNYTDATLGVQKRVGVNMGHKENGQKDLNHTAAAVPPPNNFGTDFGYPYGMPNNPANGNGYVDYIQYDSQPFAQQFPPQWPQYAQQSLMYYLYVPQYAYPPQYAPQNTQQYVPQDASQYAPQNVPQYAPQNTPQYVPQGTPQYAPQGALQYAPRYAPRRAPHYDHDETIIEYVQ